MGSFSTGSLVLLVVVSVLILTAKAAMLGVWGDGMVMQHDAPAVHGCINAFRPATIPTHIAVSMTLANGSSAGIGYTYADNSTGCFQMNLSPQPHARSSNEQTTVQVHGNHGFFAEPTLLGKATNVMFGTVIFCSGQVHPYQMHGQQKVVELQFTCVFLLVHSPTWFILCPMTGMLANSWWHLRLFHICGFFKWVGNGHLLAKRMSRRCRSDVMATVA
jgi:hypothetical protein